MQPVRGIEQHGPPAGGNRQPSGLSVSAGVQENQERLQSETTVDTRPRNRTARPSADGNRQPSGLSVRARVQENQERLQSETTVDDIIPGIFPSSL